MSHIELCRNLYYATLKVPEHLRKKAGRTKFKQTLGTGDKRKAQELAKPVVALWKAQLRQLDGEADAVQTEALRWREALAETRKDWGPAMAVELEGLITSKAQDIEGAEGEDAAKEFVSVALGYATPSRLHFDAWAASIVGLAQKTQDQYKVDVELLVGRFSTLEAMSPSALQHWTEELTTRSRESVSPSSLKRLVSSWRSYWIYLKRKRLVPAEVQPFALIELPKKSTAGTGRGGWVPFKPADVPRLARAAMDKEDTQLADLIALGAYTGARIEELCSLKWSNIGEESLHIAEAKTQAGVREVPIHPALKPLLEALKAEAVDEYVLGGLTFNKYADRSNAIGKRFGRLKAGMGFGQKQVFHSLRKTLVTLLENAGVSENLAADIVGHEKPRITYGLYSGGATLPTKTEALGKAAYPSQVGRASQHST